MGFNGVLENAGRAQVVWTMNTAAAATVMLKEVNLILMQIGGRPSIDWS